MNAWKKLLEQDARQGQIYNDKVRKEVAKSDEDEGKSSRERLGSGEEFLACQPNKNLTHEERKKVINSVKLTKALVLLGYSCWSELEPGMYYFLFYRHFDLIDEKTLKRIF